MKLYSSTPWIEELQRHWTQTKKQHHPEHATAISYVDNFGDKRVCGGPGLKASQAYPRAFGAAVAEAFLRNQSLGKHPIVNATFDKARNLKLEGDEDLWEEACLGPVFKYLLKK